ncbi:mannitol dehydrogenase family protein [Ketogulonicigenium vulgare]|uniref:mannitol dehydrogenase family protein n=1 Tax=Ketogulonicigenium vulgare TaxID=92945 RepID=UPI00235A30D3|nr:mannitol dehydrogenase family protein [Ketogulonicigenium vulgare]
MERLSAKGLSSKGPGALPADIAVPGYDRAQVTNGIVHLGIGAFHRGHMAVYVDTLLADDPHWGIIGASLRRPDTKTALEPQDGLYTVSARVGAGEDLRIIGAIREIIDASADVAPLIARMAAPEIRIFSLTVTEKGYCHDPASGALRADHPDVVADLQNPAAPRSVPGVITAALAARRAGGAGPVTVLSCDNLQGNGEIARAAITGFARRVDPALADWIAAHVTFPSTMVDRIVPATTDADRAAIAARLGVEDAWPIVTEPFHQWVIEDRFAAGRPAFDRAGAQLVADVAPFELMKLRLLNGSHSTLAYLGQLLGQEEVAQAIRDPLLGAMIPRMMADEIRPTLDVPGIDLGEYCAALVARFANPSLHHRTAQIAMDGSQKLPQRIIAPLRARIGLASPLLTLSLAGWIAYLMQCGDTIADPQAALLQTAAQGRSPAEATARVLGLTQIFGPMDDFLRDLIPQTAPHVARIIEGGPAAAIQYALKGANA